MSNLYSMTRDTRAIADLFHVSSNRATGIEPQDGISPGHVALVVRIGEDGGRELVPMNWGFVLLQPGKGPRRVSNTRDDQIMSRFWRPSFEGRRCLVPATSFSEPEDRRRASAEATWRWFAVAGDEPRPVFSFAGVWQRWNGPIRKDGVNVKITVFSILTTIPNSAPAGTNRAPSPVVLETENDRNTWLHGSPAAARALLRPLDGNRLRIVQAGAEKRDLMSDAAFEGGLTVAA